MEWNLDHGERFLIVGINSFEFEKMAPKSVERVILELDDGRRHRLPNQVSLNLHVLFHFQVIRLIAICKSDQNVLL